MSEEAEDLGIAYFATGKCRRQNCTGNMLPGMAMGQTYSGVPDFPGREVVTLSPGGPGVIVRCLKCSVCGYSVSL